MLLLSGCGGGGSTPPPGEARSALEKALDAWKLGNAPGPVAGPPPPVRVVDSTWMGGRRLGSYEVLREEQDEAARRFLVRLTYDKPAGAEEIAFVVFGKDPIWVYRQGDYERMLNMEDNPVEKNVEKKKKGRRR